tara:strand:+ start:704 stop:907 length:204 start_codon:yes stop_codon:yes gene_type:complete
MMAKKNPPNKPALVKLQNAAPAAFQLPKTAQNMLESVAEHLGGIELDAALAVCVGLAYADLVGNTDD